MYHFFVEENAIADGLVHITGDDVNHIRNVLRMTAGEQVIISRKNDNEDVDYYCSLTQITEREVTAHIDWTEETRELTNKIYLFQGLPKGDKMELIIQKSVELGVYEVIPVAMNRSVVKLDAKKEAGKLKRWQAISESAAKQSKRSIIPAVKQVMTVKEALSYAKEMNVKLLPYENEKGIAQTRSMISEIQAGESVAVLIGPEGGFAPEEVEAAKSSGFRTVTLGKRILRTETAGLMMLSVLAYTLEDCQNSREA